jgi:hypothetical protein
MDYNLQIWLDENTEIGLTFKEMLVDGTKFDPDLTNNCYLGIFS